MITGSMQKSIFKAGAFVLIANLLFKLAGLIQTMVMGRCLTAETYDVAYTFAFVNCLFLVFLIGEQLMKPTLLPVFMKEKTEGSESNAWAFANTVLTLQFFILLAVTAVFIAAPEMAVKALTRWRPDSSPEKYALAVKSVRMMAPVLLGLSLGSTTYAVLNGYKRFFLAAFGDAAWKFCTVIVLLVGFFFTKDGTQLLVWGLIAGSACKVLTHLVGLRDKLPDIRPKLALSHPALKTLGLLMLPLVVGVLITNGRDLINNVYILSAVETSGLIQANDIGKKLFGTFAFLVPTTLSVAVFPFLCELANDKDNQKMGDLVTRFGRMMLAVFTPLALFVAVMAVPFTSLIFKGGHFGPEAVRLTAVSLACYMFCLPAAAIDPLMNTAFFANRKMVSVTVIAVTFSLMSVGISWFGLQVYQQTQNELHLLAFIAGGFALTRTLKCITLVEVLKRNIPMFPFFETTRFLARMVIASGLAGGVAWFLLRQLSAIEALSGRIGDMAKLGTCAAVFAGIYFIGAYLLRIREIRELFDVVRNKVLHKGAKGR